MRIPPTSGSHAPCLDLVKGREGWKQGTVYLFISRCHLLIRFHSASMGIAQLSQIFGLNLSKIRGKILWPVTVMMSILCLSEKRDADHYQRRQEACF
jgi:hypothetical protein